MPTSHDAYKILNQTANRVINTKVVGVTKTNDNRTSRQRIIREHARPGSRLILVREPTNQYDSNAIAVHIDAGQIGFISSSLASELAPQIDSGRPLYGIITEVTGGGDFNYGVNVVLSWDDIRVTNKPPSTNKMSATTAVVIILAILVLVAILMSLSN